MYGHFANWLQQNFQIDPEHFVDNHFDFISRLKSLLMAFSSSLSNLISQSFIILVYIIPFLLQKQLFIGFFKKLVKNESAASQILKGSSKAINDYLFGKGKIMFLLFTIYYAGFTLSQVPFALFLSLFAALFSIIPYVGNIIGGGIAVILSYLYSGAAPAQLGENYVLTPWIIGDEIALNPFITVFGVILLSNLWGIVGHNRPADPWGTQGLVRAYRRVGRLCLSLEETRGTKAGPQIRTK